MMGLVKQAEKRDASNMWCDVVLTSTLRQALCSHSEQVYFNNYILEMLRP